VGAMSAIGTKRTNQPHPLMSAFGGKADIPIGPKADMRDAATKPELPRLFRWKTDGLKVGSYDYGARESARLDHCPIVRFNQRSARYFIRTMALRP
jgi:hypothetical protein